MSTRRITTPFGARSTANEVMGGVQLEGVRVIVTGGSSGIGLETARSLASAGAEDTLAVRDVEVGARAAEDIEQSAGRSHVLVNNAGVMATPETHTAEGWELQFATNHLGHFHLATGLHAALTGGRGGARIVVVSSVGHVNGEVVFDDVNFERHPYDPWTAYAQSKTANILFMVEASKRWAPDRIAVTALNPGRIPSTGLMRHMADSNGPVSFDPRSTDVSWKTIEQGAATSVLLAGSPLVEGVTGRYFEDCNEAHPHQLGIRRGVAAYALDPEKAARLWQLSVDMLAGLPEGA